MIYVVAEVAKNTNIVAEKLTNLYLRKKLVSPKLLKQKRVQKTPQNNLGS